jgi:ABC-2 type transport system permease protein
VISAYRAVARAELYRYSRAPWRMVTEAITNTVFGFLRASVLLAATVALGGVAAGYDERQIVTYAFLTQALFGVLALWAPPELGERIRLGDGVLDMLRPTHPLPTYLAQDVGRAVYTAFPRLAVPVTAGAVATELIFVPVRPLTPVLFLVSMVLAVLLVSACRFVVNVSTHWLHDTRGPQLLWMVTSGVLGGLFFPIGYLPGWVADALWLLTPFPSMLQAPADVAVERLDVGGQLLAVCRQAAWLAAVLAVAARVQRRADRRLLVQGS